MNERDKNSPTLPPPNVEPHPSNAPLAEEEATGPDSRASILVHSRRRRLTDPDGVSAKAAIDSLVKAGILVDDSALYVREVRYSQEKIKKGDEEETIITVRWEG